MSSSTVDIAESAAVSFALPLDSTDSDAATFDSSLFVVDVVDPFSSDCSAAVDVDGSGDGVVHSAHSA